MGLYETLAADYDAIFPTAPATAAFLGPPPRDGARALDAGCATGSHALELARLGWTVLGLDPAPLMVAAARSREQPSGPGSARFGTGGMLDLGAAAPPGSLSLLLCLGNTLPHLAGRNELDAFAAMAAESLEPGGRLVIQLLNYDRILRDRPSALPELGANGRVFRRSYGYRDDGYLDFITEFGSGGDWGRDLTRLWPLGPGELREALGGAGLAGIREQSGWDRSAFDPADSVVLILEAFRPR